MEGLDSLLQNKLAMQYLAGLGADLSAYGGNTDKGFQPANVNAITNQSITAQNSANQQKKLMDWMMGFLGPDKSSLSIGAGGLKANYSPDSQMYKSILGGDEMPGFQANQNLAPTTPMLSGATVQNPFVEGQPSFSASDLAGLTPEIMASNLSGALNVVGTQNKLGLARNEAATKGPMNLVDMMYKKAMIDEANSRTKENTPSISIPGIGLVTTKQYMEWEKLSKENKAAKVKEFEFAKSPEGGGFTGDFMAFQNAGDTVGMKDFKEAQRTGYKGTSYYDYKIEMGKANASNINLGTKLEEIKAKSGLSGQLYFDDPKWINDLEKTSEKYVSDNLWNKDAATKTLESAKYKAKQIEAQILAGGGSSNAAWAADGKTMVWTVKWPSGDTKEIKVKLR